MAGLDEIVLFLEGQKKRFFHFTDIENLPGIRQRGLLSMATIRGENIQVPRPGGNQWSWDADTACGMDEYVHLCFFKSHPMEWRAREEGRITKSAFLEINPEILRVNGVLVTDMVSNKSGCKPMSPEEAFDKLDLEVIYKRLDWTTAEVKERLNTAKKYEILIPNAVPLNMIMKFE